MNRTGVGLLKTTSSAHLTPKDFILMLVLTAFYAVFAFWNLGSAHAPESGWYAEEPGESVVLDLGAIESPAQLYVYTGWIDRRSTDQEVLRKLSLSYSGDGLHWTEHTIPFELKKVFSWHVFRDLPQEFRFLRLTCDDGRFYLNEAALFGYDENQRFSFQVAGSQNPTATNLADEPDKVAYEFSWYENAYFDEIYHPRTAFEYITHRLPYENTHPPLGKILIACGMLLFGVNPFGWRFFGTLCGVLMVPMTYVMGKKMLKKTSYAFMVAFLFSFDFMHLSQTRLATIDSYTAFFVMGMYLFMFLYIEKNFLQVGVKKTLLPLFASGLCFGLGAATKWQGIYAGAGLALLFFYSLAKRYGEYRQALQLEDASAARVVAKRFKSGAIQTLLAGVLFFVILPAVIYFLSYIPAMNTPQTGLSYVFTNQASMFRYHSTLEATHPYGSSWWQWLFDCKPLYAYSPNRDFVPEHMAMGITSFGNPAIWWMTIPVVVWAICHLYRNRKAMDLGLLTAVVGFFSLYVPWIFVSRTAFIYHFFPCVIFVVLMLVFLVQRLLAINKKWTRYAVMYMAIVFILFLMFYPVLTGMEIPRVYAHWLRWLPGWVMG